MTIILCRVSAWTLLATIVALTFVPPAFRPVTHLPHIVEHAAIFLLTGGVFAFTYTYQVSVGFLLVAAVSFSGCLEALQLFVPGRHARLSDAVIDGIAACIGIVIVSATGRWRKRGARRSQQASRDAV